MAKNESDDIKSVHDFAKDIEATMAKMKVHGKTVENTFKDLLGSNDQLVKSLSKTMDASEGIAIIQERIKKIMSSEIQMAGRTNTQKEEAKKLLLSKLDTAQNLFLMYQDIDNAVEKGNERLNKQKDVAKELGTNIASSILGPITRFAQEIPLVGGALGKMASEIEEQIGNKIGNSLISNFTAAGKAGVTAGVGTSLAFGPIAAIILTIAAAAYVLKRAFDYQAEAVDLTRNLGISYEAASKLQHRVHDISLENFNVTSKEALTSAEALHNEFQTLYSVSNDMIAQHAELMKFYGLEAKEASTLTSLAKQQGIEVRDVEGTILQTVTAFNSVTKSGVAFKDVMKDIATASASTRMSFKGNVEQLVLAAAKARAFGSTLDDMNTATRGMLNLEESLTAQYEAQAMGITGMNLDKIRSLRFANETEKANDEMIHQLSSMGDISKMNVFKQEALAKAYGVSIDQLAKINEQSKLRNALGTDLLTATEAQITAAASALNKSKEELIAEQHRLQASEKMSLLMSKFGEFWDGLVTGPLAGFIDGLTDILGNATAMKAIFSGIGLTFTFMFRPIKSIFEMIGEASIGFKKIFSKDGDIVGGLLDIGKVILKTIFLPFTLIFDLIQDIGARIVKTFSFEPPEWLRYILDLDTSTSATVIPATPEKRNDLIITPTGQQFETAPDDFIIATKAIPQSVGQGAQNNSNIESLLRELLNAVNQPVMLQFSDQSTQKVSNTARFSAGKSGQGAVGMGSLV